VGGGQLHDGWLDLAVEAGGEPAGRIQTFVPPDRPLAPGTFDLGISLRGGMRGKGHGPDPANHAMRAVFRHVGWREDGTLTEAGRDWLMYRITRPQWQAARG
jgi:hypothetical protein